MGILLRRVTYISHVRGSVPGIIEPWCLCLAPERLLYLRRLAWMQCTGQTDSEERLYRSIVQRHP